MITEKIAEVFARTLGGEIQTPEEIDPRDVQEYDLVGFGSGIYDSRHHQSLLDLADYLPRVEKGNAFIFSTSGTPAFALNGGEGNEYIKKAHSILREKLEARGYNIEGQFTCPGWNTNKFLKLFGGINRGRPGEEDFNRDEALARRLKRKINRERGDRKAGSIS